MSTQRVSISLIKDLSNIDLFAPIDGRWNLNVAFEDRSWQEVEEAIRNQLNRSYPIRITLYHASGLTITGDMPSEGMFVATRV